MQDNWEYISKTWGSGFLLTRFITYIVSLVSTSLILKRITMISFVSTIYLETILLIKFNLRFDEFLVMSEIPD